MKEFIHTFSLTFHLFSWEKDRIERTFCESFFYNSTDKVLVLSKYVERGVRIEIKYSSQNERKYDKEHKEYKIEIIVTPAKLLHKDESMSKLFLEDEYTAACDELKNIIKEIETLSGVSIWKEVKIKRIDVTKDVETLSENHSDEIIRLAKKSMYKAGCHIWKPTEEEIIKTGWLEKDSVLFFNHNQGVDSKIYNKAVDLKNQKQDVNLNHGLIRFEVSLKRKFLRANGLIDSDYIEIDDISGLLCRIITLSESLLKEYIAESFFEGRMLSKKLQKKIIRKYCNNKPMRYEKMMAYRDACNENAKSIKHIDAKVRERLKNHFKALRLSPIYALPEFEYIPSFLEMIEN